MAVVEMRKLSVIGLNNSRAPFVSELMHLGVVELNSKADMVDDEEWMPDIFRTSNSVDVSFLESEISRVATALEAIGKYDTAKKPLFPTREVLGRKSFAEHVDQSRLKMERDADTAFYAYKGIADSQSEINRLRAVITGLQPWESLDIPLDMHETGYVDVILGTASAKTDTAKLAAAAQEQAASAIVQEVSRDKQQKYYAMICLKEEKEQALEAMHPFGFTTVNLADEGTAQEAIFRYEKQIKDAEAQIAAHEKTLTELAPARKDIEYFYDELVMHRDRAKIVGNMLTTDTVFYFDGWMPKRAQGEVEELLKRYEFYYEIQEPAEEDDPPVLLSNNGLVTPFEAVTGMYSLPGKGDIDPTAILAPFYFIFFGLMLSDAAYGLILTTLCAIVLKKYKLEGTTYRMMKMFMLCGISTFMWGALFGGWFGNFFTVAADTFFGKEFTIKPLWFDPLSEPMRLLIVSLILGAIHLFVGMGVQAYMDIKDGRPLDALFDIGLWYALLIGIVMFAFGGSIAPAMTGVGKVLAIVGAVGILLTGGRAKKGIFGKLTGGLGSLYGITSYLSDVLSYSRLLALGLATGVVAQVFNTLGSLAGGGVAGCILLLVVWIFGTIFNLAINALGAFVHSCRLQYVEFFGKFYTGGGRPFTPFERKTKYIKIIKEGNDNE